MSETIPDDAYVSMRWVREHYVPRVSTEKRELTTTELSAALGHSASWWQDHARAGRIKGAYQVGSGRVWYVPLEEATVFLREHREKQTEGRRRRARKPWGLQKAS